MQSQSPKQKPMERPNPSPAMKGGSKLEPQWLGQAKAQERSRARPTEVSKVLTHSIYSLRIKKRVEVRIAYSI